MLRAGVGWPRSARSCGTASVLTTAIYAKVDRRRLARGGAALAGARHERAARRTLDRLPRAPPRARLQARTRSSLLADFVALRRTGREQRTITVDAASRGRPCRQRRRRSGRRSGSVVRAASPATCTPSTRPTRCRRRAAARRGPTGPRPTCTTDADIAALMAAARALPPPLRAATFETLVGLLAATGMRIGEAMRLDRDDVDLVDGVLTVRDTKFGKSRQVPLHASTVDALRGLRVQRDRLCPRPTTASVLRLHRRRPAASRHRPADGFRLSAEAGLSAIARGCRPRMHDLRHSFAVRTLLGWYRDGATCRPACRCCRPTSVTSTPAATYWYLSAAPELLHAGRGPAGATVGEPVVTALAPILQAFFTDRLIAQRRASPHTVASYRDTFRLLLGFAHARTGKRRPHAGLRRPRRGRSSARSSTTSNANATTACGPATPDSPRSTRCSRYAALRHPEHADLIQRVLAIPPKRVDRTTCRSSPPTRSTRCSPPPTAPPGSVGATTPCSSSPSRPGCGSPNSPRSPAKTSSSARGAHVRCHGKGRKAALHPADPPDVARPPRLAARTTTADPADPLFPTRRGRPAEPRRRRADSSPSTPRTAPQTCPTLAGKTVTPHVLRHTAAMRLLPPASTPPSSRSGSATKGTRRPRSTSTPTSTLKETSSRPDHPHRHHARAATAHPTHSSPSSSSSPEPPDYAENRLPFTNHTGGCTRRLRITRYSA